MSSAGEGSQPGVALQPGFRDTESRRLLLEKGINVDLCFQCRKCASGCWASDLVDINATQMVHALRLGLEDLALQSRLIWLCTKCATCSTRCPQDVDIAGVSSLLRVMAHRRGVPSKLPGITALDRVLARNMLAFGRVYELGLINRLRMATGKFGQDIDLALPMVVRRKIGFLPSFGGYWKMRQLKSRAARICQGRQSESPRG